MATEGQDTFASGGRGTPNAWSPASDGQNWTQASGASTLSIVSSRGQLTGTANRNVLLLGTKTVTDIEVSARMSGTSASDTIGLVARAVNGNNYYVLRVTSSTTLAISKLVSSSPTDLATATVTFAASTNYWMRFRVQGPNLYGRYWADGSSEPSTWNITVGDTTYINAGQFGIHAKPANTTTIQSFDTFLATDAPISKATIRQHRAMAGFFPF